MSLVLVAHYDAVATVTLIRPEAMNALSRALRAELAAVMRRLAADDGVRAIVLTGAGERAFTAGLDLKELGADTSNLGAANATDADENPVKAIELCPQPVGNFLGAEAARDWGLVNRVVAPEELVPAAQALARDIASADPAMVRRYKRLIDDGYALPFGDAMALEHARSSAANRAVRAEEVEARRMAVMQRGRANI